MYAVHAVLIVTAAHVCWYISRPAYSRFFLIDLPFIELIYVPTRDCTADLLLSADGYVMVCGSILLRDPNLLGSRYFSPIFYHFCRCHTPCCQTVGILFTSHENYFL